MLQWREKRGERELELDKSENIMVGGCCWEMANIFFVGFYFYSSFPVEESSKAKSKDETVGRERERKRWS